MNSERRAVEMAEVESATEEYSSQQATSGAADLESGEHRRIEREEQERNELWIQRMIDFQIIVAVLLVPVGIHLVTNPPGAFWGDSEVGGGNQTRGGGNQTECGGNQTRGHEAGKSVLSDMAPVTYYYFVGSATLSFVVSISLVLMRTCGFYVKRMWCVWVISGALWFAVMATVATYLISVVATTSKHAEGHVVDVVFYSLVGWAAGVVLVFLGCMCYKVGKHIQRNQTSRLRNYFRFR